MYLDFYLTGVYDGLIMYLFGLDYPSSLGRNLYEASNQCDYSISSADILCNGSNCSIDLMRLSGYGGMILEY